MKEYHKIQTIFKRDPATKFKTLLEGEYSLPEFEYLKNNKWIFTEKVDGTNIRIMYNGMGQMKIGGKTDNAQIPSFLYDEINRLITAEKLEEIFKDSAFCLYGEGHGAKIQKGGGNYKPDGVSFVLFDVKVDDWWLKRDGIEDVASSLGIDTVPIIGEGTLQDAIEMTQEGFNSVWGNFKAEGIVLRPEVELKARNGKRIITKIKCKDF